MDTHNKYAKDIIDNDLEYITNNLNEELIFLEGKDILITGGGGFLGYYLVQTLIYWNQKVSESKKIKLTIYDNFMRGKPSWITEIEKNSYLKVLLHDITKPLKKDMPFYSYIIHAASIASPTYYRKYPIETMDANVNGLRFFLDWCVQKKSQNFNLDGFLFYSTSEIYGDPAPDAIPTPETYRGNVSCTGPRACYDESKRYGETLCVNFALQYNLPIKIVRPFNNYGPGLKITDKRVIPDFARDIFTDRNIIMHSNGKPTRTFCYVSDAIVGYYKALIKGKDGEAYNIGVDSPEISIAYLAEQMTHTAKDLFGYQGQVVHQASTDSEYLVDNPNRRCPDITKARRELDYNPAITLEDGLRRTLIWYKENQEAREEQ